MLMRKDVKIMMIRGDADAVWKKEDTEKDI